MNRLWCPKKLYYIWRFFNTKMAVKRFLCHLMIFFAENYLCEFNHAKIVKFAKLGVIGPPPCTIHNNLQICEFYIYKIHSCKMVMNSMIYFWQHTQKNNICSIVQRFPTTAMKIIFIRGWMTKQHTYNFVEQISNMSK